MLGLYIHIPFCKKKCYYCNFNSISNANDYVVEMYVRSVIDELATIPKTFDIKDNISSIYFGGGTPISIDFKYIQAIFSAINNIFSIQNDAEITIESNPIINANYQSLKNIGFNRISIGVQSFNDNELQVLGRLHSAALAESSLQMAMKYFDNVNLDIIYSIPLQTLNSLQSTLAIATNLGIKHISAYSLIFEEGTPLYSKLINNEITQIDEDLDCDMYLMLCENLQQQGLIQYEVSNFAIPKYESKHNLNYWNRGNYFGIGVSAHSFFNNIRYSNISDVQTYCEKIAKNISPINNKEELTQNQIYEEQIFLGLRSSGIPLEIIPPEKVQFIEECIKYGYAYKHNYKFILTHKGKFITDAIVLRII
jgi:oxygen-independent coproporphyrinogen-3 oxidase